MATESKIVLTADDSSAAGWNSFSRRGSESFAKMEEGAKAASSTVGLAFAGALGGAMTMAGLAQFSANILQSIDALNDAADATGSTIEKMSALDNFAREAGASLQDLTSIILTMEKGLSKAGDTEDKGLGSALKAIGVSADELRKMDPADAIKKVADAFAEFEDGPGKTRAIQAIFKDAEKAAPILKDLAEKQELVSSVTKEQADEVDKLVKSWAGLTASGNRFSTDVGNYVVPALNDIIEFTIRAQKEYGTLSGILVGLVGGGALKAFGIELNESKRAVADAAEAFGKLAEARRRMAENESALGNSGNNFFSRLVIKSNIDSASKDVARYTAELKAANAEVARLAAAAPRGAAPQKALDYAGVAGTPSAGTGKGRAAKELTEAEELVKVLEKIQALRDKDAGLDPAYQQNLATLTQGFTAGRLSIDDYRSAAGALYASQKMAKDVLVDEEKARKEAEKALSDYYDTWTKYLDGLDKEAAALDEQVATWGLSKTALAQLTLARAEERLEVAKAAGVQDDYLLKLEEEVAVRKKIVEATGNVESLAANKKAADEAAAEWLRVSDDIGKGLTDAIFSGGKSGWELLKKTIEATVIRAAVQPVVTQGVQGVMQSLGFGGSGGGGGGGLGSLGNLFSTGSSLLGASSGVSAFTGATGYLQFGSMASSFGTGLSAVAGGADLAGAIAAYEAAGMGATAASLSAGAATATAVGAEAAGVMASAMSGLMAAAPYLAVAMLVAQQLGAFDGPTDHHGGAYMADTNGVTTKATDQNFQGFGLSWGAYTSDRADAYDNVTEVLSLGLASQIGASIKQFGGADQKLLVGSRFTSDNNDWSEGSFRVINEAGDTLYDIGKRYTSDSTKALEEFSAESSRALVATLQQLDLDNLFDAMFDSIDPLSASIEDLNALLSDASTLVQAFGLDSEAAQQAVIDSSMSGFDAFFSMGEQLNDAAASGALSATQIATGLQQRYALEVSLLQEITSLMSSSTSGYKDSIRSIKLDVLDNEGKYAYLDAEASGFRDLLATLTDPTQISDTSMRLRSSLDQSWGLLTPEQKLASGQKYIDLYTAADDLTTERLGAAKQAILDSQDKLISDIKTAVTDAYLDVADSLKTVGDAIPEKITVSLTINGTGEISGEVGTYDSGSGGM